MSFIENPLVQDILVLAFLIAVSVIIHYLFKKYVLQLLHGFFIKTPTVWDQFLFEKGVFDALSLVIPGIILYQGVAFLVVLQDIAAQFFRVWVVVVVVVVVVDRSHPP